VTLEVYDEQGLSSRRVSQVEVQFALPTASFSYAPWRPGTGETIWFDASTSTTPNGKIVEYRWSFGNGDWDVGEKVGYMYWYGGAYPVTLTIVDEVGATAQVTQVIEVQGGPGCYTGQ
jgi:hypothetical protein